jgi:hypothetical protein
MLTVLDDEALLLGVRVRLVESVLVDDDVADHESETSFVTDAETLPLRERLSDLDSSSVTETECVVLSELEKDDDPVTDDVGSDVALLVTDEEAVTVRDADSSLVSEGVTDGLAETSDVGDSDAVGDAEPVGVAEGVDESVRVPRELETLNERDGLVLLDGVGVVDREGEVVREGDTERVGVTDDDRETVTLRVREASSVRLIEVLCVSSSVEL